ncbi:MAG TPA: hypothetical protein PLA83_13055 [Deltaproteobacteria bacterium]|nr:hypothetical protein [Deltaproteobacteria bacterium]
MNELIIKKISPGLSRPDDARFPASPGSGGQRVHRPVIMNHDLPEHQKGTDLFSFPLTKFIDSTQLPGTEYIVPIIVLFIIPVLPSVIPAGPVPAKEGSGNPVDRVLPEALSPAA